MQMGYGEELSCERPAAKNRVTVYDRRTNKESLLFNKPLSDRMAPSPRRGFRRYLMHRLTRDLLQGRASTTA